MKSREATEMATRFGADTRFSPGQVTGGETRDWIIVHIIGPRIMSPCAGLGRTDGYADVKTNYTLPRKLEAPGWKAVEYRGMSIMAGRVPEVLKNGEIYKNTMQ